MRAIAFILMLSLALLSTAALAGESSTQATRMEVSNIPQANNPISRGSKADVPGLINHQGTLTDEDGVALDTTVSMTFSIYPLSTGGTAVWTETQPAVVVSSGIFNVLLGSVSSIPDTVFKEADRWLGVQIGSDPVLEPLQRIAAVGYAFRAAEADTANYARAQAASDGDWTIVGSDMHSTVPGNVGIGSANPLSKLVVRNPGANELQYALRLTNPDVTDTGGTATGILFETEPNNYGKGALIYERKRNFARGDFHFLQNESGGYDSPSLSDAVVTIKNDGSVGIGTTSPGSMLDVSGDVNADSVYQIGGATVLSLQGGFQNLLVGLGAGENSIIASYTTCVGNYAGHNSSDVAGTFVGYEAGYSNAGTYNTFIGSGAGRSNTEGYHNTFLGAGAGKYNTEGSRNTFLGEDAGRSNTTASYNTFVGTDAGWHTTTAGANTYIGYYAGYHNTTGYNNTFLGQSTGFHNTFGSTNTFLGNQAGINNTTGSSNTFVGEGAGYYNETGVNNTILGRIAGSWNTSGSGNVFIGHKAGYYETGSDKLYIANDADTGSVLIYGDFSTGHVGIGMTTPAAKLDVSGDINADSLYKINGNSVLSASGIKNIFVGTGAGANNTGNYVTFVGDSTGYNNQGDLNTFLGVGAGMSNTIGEENTFLGAAAGLYNETGWHNTFVGRQAGVYNFAGGGNTFLGAYTGEHNTSGNDNTFLGFQAGHSGTSGNENTFIGFDAGYSHTTGSGNVFLGYRAGYYETGSNKLYIDNSGTSSPLIYGEFDNDILTINGDLGIGTASPDVKLTIEGPANGMVFAKINQMGNRQYMGLRLDRNDAEKWFIGMDAWNEKLIFRRTASSNDMAIDTTGMVGIGTYSPGYKLDVAGQAHATGFPTSSDSRLKANVKQLGDVLDRLEKIRGVSFDWNEHYESMGRSTGHREIGVIAQEVEAQFPELVTTWGEEDYRAVDYGRLTGVLIEAIKELRAENRELREEIEAIRSEIR